MLAKAKRRTAKRKAIMKVHAINNPNVFVTKGVSAHKASRTAKKSISRYEIKCVGRSLDSDALLQVKIPRVQ